MPRPARSPLDTDDLVQRYLGGESEQSLAVALGGCTVSVSVDDEPAGKSASPL